MKQRNLLSLFGLLLLSSALTFAQTTSTTNNTNTESTEGTSAIATLGDLYNHLVVFITEIATAVDENIAALRSTQDLSGVLPQYRPAVLNQQMADVIQHELSSTERQHIRNFASSKPNPGQFTELLYNTLVYPYTNDRPNLSTLPAAFRPVATTILSRPHLTNTTLALKKLLRNEDNLLQCQTDLHQQIQKTKNSNGRPASSTDEPAPETCTVEGARANLADLKSAGVLLGRIGGLEIPPEVKSALNNIKSVKSNGKTAQRVLDQVQRVTGYIPTLANWTSTLLKSQISQTLTAGNSTEALMGYTIDSLIEPLAYATTTEESNATTSVCSPKSSTPTAAETDALSYLHMLQNNSSPPDLSAPTIPISRYDVLVGGQFKQLSYVGDGYSLRDPKDRKKFLVSPSEGAGILRYRDGQIATLDTLRQEYSSAASSFVAARNLSLSNLTKLYNDRHELITINIDGKEAQCTPAEVKHHMANWRLNPQHDWHSLIAGATPINVARQQVYLLAEIRQQLYQNQKLMERMLATQSMSQLQILQQQQENIQKTKQTLQDSIKDYIKGKAGGPAGNAGAAATAVTGSLPSPE